MLKRLLITLYGRFAVLQLSEVCGQHQLCDVNHHNNGHGVTPPCDSLRGRHRKIGEATVMIAQVQDDPDANEL